MKSCLPESTGLHSSQLLPGKSGILFVASALCVKIFYIAKKITFILNTPFWGLERWLFSAKSHYRNRKDCVIRGNLVELVRDFFSAGIFHNLSMSSSTSPQMTAWLAVWS